MNETMKRIMGQFIGMVEGRVSEKIEKVNELNRQMEDSVSIKREYEDELGQVENSLVMIGFMEKELKARAEELKALIAEEDVKIGDYQAQIDGNQVNQFLLKMSGLDKEDDDYDEDENNDGEDYNDVNGVYDYFEFDDVSVKSGNYKEYINNVMSDDVQTNDDELTEELKEVCDDLQESLTNGKLEVDALKRIQEILNGGGEGDNK